MNAKRSNFNLSDCATQKFISLQSYTIQARPFKYVEKLTKFRDF